MSKFDVSGFLAEFFDEARNRLQIINQKLVSLEAGELDSAGLIQLRRNVHTIKGSAQMLGVQDISDLCHVFEDAVDLVATDLPANSLPTIQFLLDLHDSLQSRLEHQDAEVRLDITLKQAEFEELKREFKTDLEAIKADSSGAPMATEATDSNKALTATEATEATDSNKAPMAAEATDSNKDPTAAEVAAPRKRVRRKKKTKVAHSLIAAVMGSIEVSLDKNDTKEQESTEATQAEPAVKVEETADEVKPVEVESAQESVNLTEESPVISINFRPDLPALNVEANSSQTKSGNFLRVDGTRLNQLSNQVVELAAVRHREDSAERQLLSLAREFRLMKDKIMSDNNENVAEMAPIQALLDRHLRQLQQCNTGLLQQQNHAFSMLDGVRDQLFGLMLRPLSSVFSIFPRTVRDLSKRSGKSVELLVTGDSVEMDQLAAESLTEPMIHLINNAISHGIETPEERVQCGKPEKGQITISAKQTGNTIQLNITDDGKGMDVDEIREKAITHNIISQSEADDMDRSEILELIFHPGFSTLEEASELAGRGMGMAIVLDVMSELTGNIHIHSEKGQGTQFSMTFPVSLTIQKAKLFRIASHSFAMLDNLIVQAVPLNDQEIQKGAGPFSRGYINFEAHRVPIIDLRDAMGGGVAESEQAKVLIVEYLEGFLAIVVDEIMNTSEVMIRELDPYLKHYQPVGLMGCTITNDGAVHLIIEPSGLKEMWRTAPDIDLLDQTISDNNKFDQRVLLIDDSRIALSIEKKMFEKMGFNVDTAMGGADALEKVGLNEYSLIVTDLEMPDIDGIALIKHFRHKLKYTVPIIIIATRATEAERKRALDAGANAYIAKRQLKGGETKLMKLFSKLLNG